MARRKRPAGKAELTLTSMMDIVFLLIIFFLLVTNFVSQELPEMEVPKPYVSISRNVETERITVNVVPSEKSSDKALAGKIVVSNIEIEPSQGGELTKLLITEKEAAEGRGKKFEVDLRAHKTLQYNQVAPVMEAITAAGIKDVNMVMKTED